MSFRETLNKMRTAHGTQKGVEGEKVVWSLLYEYVKSRSGLLYHSYEFEVDPDKHGNIKKANGSFYYENLGDRTEIDILLVTKWRVFPIEVKTYDCANITLTTEAISGCAVTNKSPLHQNEMHANHLYSWIWEGVQNDTKFVIPITCFATWDNRPVIHDKRPPAERSLYPVVNMSTLLPVLQMLDVPNGAQLNLEQMQRLLATHKISVDNHYENLGGMK